MSAWTPRRAPADEAPDAAERRRAARDAGERSRILADWLAARVEPDGRRAEGLVVHGLAPPASGMSSDTQLFRAAWSRDGRVRRLDAVLRAAPSEAGPFPSYDMVLQFHVMDGVRRHTACPVPEVLWHEEDPDVLGTPFLVMRRVAGEAPLDFRPSYQAAGFYRDASPAGRRLLWRGIVDAVAALHRADWRTLAIPGLPGSAPGDPDPGGAALAYWRDYHLHWLKDDPAEVVPAFDEALTFLERERPQHARTAILWGDAKLGNVMFAPGPPDARRVAALVDWEMATLGDPELDLASLWFSDQRAQEEAGGALDGTPDEAELVAMYEAASAERVGNFHYAQIFATFWRGAVQTKFMRRMRAEGAQIPDAPSSDSLPVRTLRRLLGL
jgi:aminoglycoside phosphotransferase (APT) family kinase protein